MPTGRTALRNQHGATAVCAHPFLPLVRALACDNSGEHHPLLPTSLREIDSVSYLKESAEFKASHDDLAVSPATEPEHLLCTDHDPSPKSEGSEWAA